MPTTTVTVNFLRRGTRDAGKFEEGKHPRATNGEFGRGSGSSSSGSAKAAKPLQVPTPQGKVLSVDPSTKIVVPAGAPDYMKKAYAGKTVSEIVAEGVARKQKPADTLSSLGAMHGRGDISIGGGASAKQPETKTPVAAQVASPAKALPTKSPNATPSPKPVSSGKALGPITQGALDDSDRAAFKEYQHGDYANLNDRLRKGDASGKIVKDLDAAISKGALSSKTTLYRGLASDKPFSNFKVGATITDPAYVSTSTDHSVSEDFSVGVGLQHTVTMHIDAPRGTNAAFFKEYDGYTHNEVLLPRNTKYRVTKVVKGDDGHMDVHAQIVS